MNLYNFHYTNQIYYLYKIKLFVSKNFYCNCNLKFIKKTNMNSKIFACFLSAIIFKL